MGYFPLNVARRWKLLLYTQQFRMKSRDQRVWSPEPETVLPSVDLMILEAIKLLNKVRVLLGLRVIYLSSHKTGLDSEIQVLYTPPLRNIVTAEKR